MRSTKNVSGVSRGLGELISYWLEKYARNALARIHELRMVGEDRIGGSPVVRRKRLNLYLKVVVVTGHSWDLFRLQGLERVVHST